MSFEFYDPAMDVRITAGNLPHWFQPGVTYFITFRTADSLPVKVVQLWLRRRDDWLQRHGIEACTVAGGTRRSQITHPNGTRRVPATDWAAELQKLPLAKQREFHDLFSREFMEHLDRGHGECVLKRSDLAKIVADNFRHNDGQQYLLGDFVIMPNHVHVLVGLLGEIDLERQCTSWKKYTATQINRVLGRRGRFWQEETFDHLVRSSEQFDGLRRYIAENPIKAGLREGEFLHWRRPM
jgi:REP element-mobilizing transposase RayT